MRTNPREKRDKKNKKLENKREAYPKTPLKTRERKLGFLARVFGLGLERARCKRRRRDGLKGFL